LETRNKKTADRDKTICDEEAEIVEEFPSHLQDRYLEFRSAGQTEDEARGAVLVELSK